MQSFLYDVKDIWAWLVSRWHLEATLPMWAVIAAIAVIVASCTYRPTWIWLRHGATIIHEMGHVTTAWLVGRRIEGIRLHTDTSGLTISSGRPRGLGVLLTFLSGYTAPPVVGLGLIWAATAGWAGAALTGLCGLLVLAFLLARNSFGLVTVTIALAITGYVYWRADATSCTILVLAIGIFLLFAGARGPMDLLRVHRAGEGAESDASQAAAHSVLPPVAWVGFFMAASGTCLFQAGSLVADYLYG